VQAEGSVLVVPPEEVPLTARGHLKAEGRLGADLLALEQLRMEREHTDYRHPLHGEPAHTHWAAVAP